MLFLLFFTYSTLATPFCLKYHRFSWWSLVSGTCSSREPKPYGPEASDMAGGHELEAKALGVLSGYGKDWGLCHVGSDQDLERTVSFAMLMGISI